MIILLRDDITHKSEPINGFGYRDSIFVQFPRI